MRTTSSTAKNNGCRAGALADVLHASVVGDGEVRLTGVAALAEAGPGALSFVTPGRAAAALAHTQASAVLITQAQLDALEAARAAPPADGFARTAWPTWIVCESPARAMVAAAGMLAAVPPIAIDARAQAAIDPSAHVDATACIGAGAFVGAGATVGAHAIVAAHASVGPGARIGAHSVLHPGARVLWGCTLGERVVLQAGAIVGSDGFGYLPGDAGAPPIKVPQVGTVVLEDDVEVGANSTIDRATFGTTRIGAGSKIDNLVQVAHNVVLGAGCIVVAQSGIAGSTVLGERVTVGAQAGIVGHTRIAAGTTLAARTGVIGAIEAPGVFAGAPSMPHRAWLRMVAAMRDLPQLRRRVAALETRAHPAQEP